MYRDMLSMICISMPETHHLCPQLKTVNEHFPVFLTLGGILLCRKK